MVVRESDGKVTGWENGEMERSQLETKKLRRSIFWGFFSTVRKIDRRRH